jgi:hypothetical protein
MATEQKTMGSRIAMVTAKAEKKGVLRVLMGYLRCLVERLTDDASVISHRWKPIVMRSAMSSRKK